MLKIIRAFLDNVGIKFDPFKIKKIVDCFFVLVEKTIIKIDGFLSFYLSFYEQMIENEIELVDIDSGKKVLHIGCGSVPATCILISEKTKCNVVGIDNDLKAVKQANNLIRKRDLLDKINICLAEGEEYPVDSFDVIIVSQGIKPSFEILKKIALSIQKTSCVIYRTNILKDGSLSDEDACIRDFFEIKKVVHQKNNALLASVLLKK